MASSRGFSLKEILAKLRSASRTRPSHEPKQLFPQPDGYEPISLSVAGIMYEDRAQQVRQCVLREPVWLVRDRDNVHDVHAIRVLNRNDEMLGFVGRHMTPHLAEYVDTSDNPVQAVITELMSDVAGSVIAAKIGLFVPASRPLSHRNCDLRLDNLATLWTAGVPVPSTSCWTATSHDCTRSPAG